VIRLSASLVAALLRWPHDVSDRAEQSLVKRGLLRYRAVGALQARAELTALGKSVRLELHARGEQ
jgi:hypothetical protein